MTASDRELLTALLDYDRAPRIHDIHIDDCEDDACPGCDPVHLAEVHLQSLLAAPPRGHCPELQPPDWYKRVFADLAAAHPEKCTTAKAGGQS